MDLMRLLLTITASVMLVGIAAQPAQGQELSFVIRVDDIQSRSSISPRSLRPLEDIVEARGARLTYALIPARLTEPQNLDGVLASELRDAAVRGHEISQHGYDHICNRCGQSGHEMYCTTFGSPFTFEQQLDVVQSGIDLIVDQLGVTPGSFVPPGHVTDATTFEVLEQAAIPIVSTPETSQNQADVVNLPPTEEYTWAFTASAYREKMTAALADIRDAEKYFMLLLHDPFTRPGYEDGLVIDWVGELLDSLIVEYGDEIRFMTLTEAVTEMTVGLEPEDELPSTAVSLDVYPNPTTDGVTIRWAAPAGTPFSIRVFDVSGREVRTVDSGVARGNITENMFRGVELAAGTYVVRLQSGERHLSRPLVVLP
jgi:peptidoglycan/xylan/chitin deacetylase (PgdA/CDA1 family)